MLAGPRQPRSGQAPCPGTGRTRWQESQVPGSMTTLTWIWCSSCSFLPSFSLSALCLECQRLHTPSRTAAHTHNHRPAFTRPGGVCLFAGNRSVLSRAQSAPGTALGGLESNHTNSVRLPVLIPALPPGFPCPSLSPARSSRRLPLPRSLGSRDGGAVRQEQPPPPWLPVGARGRGGARGSRAPPCWPHLCWAWAWRWPALASCWRWSALGAGHRHLLR